MLVQDQMGNTVKVPDTPARIVSLVPSQTELLFDLGVENHLVGITRYCVHPADGVRKIAKIGGTKKFNFQAIDKLEPDLVIGNKEENYQSGIERLRQKYPVWMSDVYDIDDALDMIEKVGCLVHREAQAGDMIASIRASLENLNQASETEISYSYLIWRKPYICVGENTFIHNLLKSAGYRNAFADLKRYPEITLEQLQERSPQVVFLSSEPYPFDEEHLNELTDLLPDSHVMLVDGEMLSWYGSRLLQTAGYLAKLKSRLDINIGGEA